MRFKSFLRNLALQHSAHPRFKHAALLAQGKRIVASGVNEGWVHAEIRALHMLEGNPSLKGCTLYTLMVRKSGSLGNGSPCPECMAALKAAGVKKVVVYV